MRISFDIDDTLICIDPALPLDPVRVPFFLRWWLHERVRKGTCELMRQLTVEGWEIAVYTTSYRSPHYLRWLLRWYGARVVEAVNGEIHVNTIGPVPTKLPSRFGIRLHVDDSEGVRIEGEQHGFEVVVVQPDDEAWVDVVLARAREIKAASATR